MIVLVTVGRRPAAADDPVALPARRLRVPRRRRGRRRAASPTASTPERAELLARLAGGRLDRARALDGRLGPVRDAFVAAAAALDGTGGAVAAQAELVQDAHAGARSPSSKPRRPRRPSSSRPSSRPRGTPTARGARSCADSRSSTSARTATRAPTRCSRASPRSRPCTATRWPARAPSALNVDRERARRSTPRAAAAALDACRDARQAHRRVQPERDAAPRAALPPPPRRRRRSGTPSGAADASRYTRRRAGVAQTAEQLTRNEQAKGSSPFSGSTAARPGHAAGSCRVRRRRVHASLVPYAVRKLMTSGKAAASWNTKRWPPS